jgi:hypothetical protein
VVPELDRDLARIRFSIEESERSQAKAPGPPPVQDRDVRWFRPFPVADLQLPSSCIELRR